MMETNPATNVQRAQKLLATGIIIAACTISYSPSVKNGLSRDDIYIFQNLATQSKNQTFFQAFRNLTATIESSQKSGLLRPVSHFSFILEAKLGGLDPGGFHLMNLFLHAFAAILLFYFAAAVTGNFLASLLAAVFFSVHPVHFEAVGLIHNRSDIFCLIFLLASFLFFQSYAKRKGAKYFLGSLISYTFALLSKETAVLFPLVIVAHDYFFLAPTAGGKTRGDFLKKYAPYLIVLIGYFLLRKIFLGAMIPAERAAGYYNFLPGKDMIWFAATPLKLFGFYVSLLFNSFDPLDFCADYFFGSSRSFLEPAVLYGWLVLAAVIFLAVKFRKRPVVVLGTTWFFATYLPVSNLVPIGNLVAQHYLYIPSVGFFLAVGSFLTKIFSDSLKNLWVTPRNKLINIFLFIVVIFWARSTFLRNVYYKDDVHLWYYTAKHPLASPRAHLVMGQYYIRAENYHLARIELLFALNRNPAYHPANMMMGYVYKKQGFPERAAEYFNRAADFARQRNDIEPLKEAQDELNSLGSAASCRENTPCR